MLDHVRIPFDYNIVQDANGNFIEEGFQRIADAVANCRKCGLDVVLDLHKTAGFSFDYQPNFSENIPIQLPLNSSTK